ncbi:MAG: DUF4221 family protein [Flavobacteriales bacterium]|nr:DUF4221 family protein [Flavobacteriales bacterium]
MAVCTRCSPQNNQLAHVRDYVITPVERGQVVLYDLLDTDSGVFALTWNAPLRDVTFHALSDSGYESHVSLKVFEPSMFGSQENLYILPHNRDSLFVVPEISTSVYLLDHQGAVQDTFRLDRLSPSGNDRYRLSVNLYSPMLYIPPYLYLSMVKEREPGSERTNDGWYPGTLPFKVVNIKGDSLVADSIPVSWPELKNENMQFSLIGPMCTQLPDSQLIFHYTNVPLLQRWDRDNGLETYDPQGKFFGRIPHYDEESARADLDYIRRFILECPSYLYLVYDPYRHLYFRSYYPEMRLKIKDDMLPRPDDQSWYLMVMDEQFNVLDEIPMTSDYNPYFIKPVREGLLIAQKKTNRFSNQFSISLFTYHQR